MDTTPIYNYMKRRKIEVQPFQPTIIYYVSGTYYTKHIANRF